MTQTAPAQPTTRNSARGWILGGGAALALIALAVVGATLPSPAAPSTRWNVVLITLDTTRADRLGCYGYGRADTPTIDALSRQGVQYLRCYSPVPVTLPSHSSLLTGLDPPRHGIHTNGPDALSADAETLAELLHGEG
ncbi:unnamed protein product, partial [marine sediment metagenome]